MITKEQYLKALEIIDQYHQQLDLSNFIFVERSFLLKVVRGDRVKCLYGNSGNKFWANLLEKYPTVDKIQYDPIAKFCRFTFKEDDKKDNWFYENDFIKV